MVPLPTAETVRWFARRTDAGGDRSHPQRPSKARKHPSAAQRYLLVDAIVCQKIAQMANAEDGEVGKFWQSRYRAVRLLDETAVLAASAYVALNPIRAGIAETLKASDFTSVQRPSRCRRCWSGCRCRPRPGVCWSVSLGDSFMSWRVGRR